MKKIIDRNLNVAILDEVKVSVVIPMYNSMSYITRALDSVVAQTYPVHEIIVVDDGSKDDSVRIVRCYIQNHEKSPIMLITQVNRGPAVARNNGIMVASGNVIAFLDADDSWTQTKIAEQIRYLHMNPYVGLISTRHSTGKLRNTISATQVSFFSLLLLNQIITSSVIVKKTVLEDVGLFSNKKYSEDYELWLRIANKYSVIILNQGLTCYTISYSGLSSKLWKMENAELGNYSSLLSDHRISFVGYLLICSFSLLKYAIRVMTSVWGRLFCRQHFNRIGGVDN